jgi:hypothetical protein
MRVSPKARRAVNPTITQIIKEKGDLMGREYGLGKRKE